MPIKRCIFLTYSLNNIYRSYAKKFSSKLSNILQSDILDYEILLVLPVDLYLISIYFTSPKA